MGAKTKKYMITLLLFSMGSLEMMGGALVAPGLAGLTEAFQVSGARIGSILSTLT